MNIINLYKWKKKIFKQISKFKILSFLLHKIWVYIQLIRSKYLYFRFYSLKKEIFSLSDRGQDKWIIHIFELKKKPYKGFFLEIGGGDGFANSNTFILEKYHGWKGILVEPDPGQFKKLKIHRPNAILSREVINERNEEVKFSLNGELSSIVEDHGIKNLKKSTTFNSITLLELLEKNKCPKIIDYFSLDVEGNEDKVLLPSILNKYTFLSLTIERVTPELHELLLKRNYFFIRQNIYDSFYINKKIKNFEKIILERK